MAKKLKPKPRVEEYDANQWRGFATFPLGKDLLPREQEAIASSVDDALDFEAWCKKHLKGKKIKYRGNDLVIEDKFDSHNPMVVKPGMWIVMIPDEYGNPEMNLMTNEQVTSYYYADNL